MPQLNKLNKNSAFSQDIINRHSRSTDNKGNLKKRKRERERLYILFQGDLLKITDMQK